LLRVGCLSNRLILSFCLRFFNYLFNNSSRFSFSSGFFLTAASSCRLPLCSSRSIFLVYLIVINQLNKRHFRVVARAVFQFDNTRVSSRTVRNFLRNLTEENGHSFFVLQIAKYRTA